MTRILLAVGALSIGFAIFAPINAASADIERACQQSDRSISPALCHCIGRVADAKLNRTEQRKVAKWFADPDQAQNVRQSDRVSDNLLWKRYKAFGETAAKVCS